MGLSEGLMPFFMAQSGVATRARGNVFPIGVAGYMKEHSDWGLVSFGFGGFVVWLIVKGYGQGRGSLGRALLEEMHALVWTL